MAYVEIWYTYYICIKNLKSYEKCLPLKVLLRTFRFQKYENGTTRKENSFKFFLHWAKIDINVTEIQCLWFLSSKHQQLIIDSCDKMLFGAEGRVDKWERLCDVCIHMEWTRENSGE